MRVVEEFRAKVTGVMLVNVYSTWESVDVAYANLSDPLFSGANSVSKFAPCGEAMLGVQVYVCDEAQQLVPMVSNVHPGVPLFPWFPLSFSPSHSSSPLLLSSALCRCLNGHYCLPAF